LLVFNGKFVLLDHMCVVLFPSFGFVLDLDLRAVTSVLDSGVRSFIRSCLWFPVSLAEQGCRRPSPRYAVPAAQGFFPPILLRPNFLPLNPVSVLPLMGFESQRFSLAVLTA
jgi:hypothetical protein